MSALIAASEVSFTYAQNGHELRPVFLQVGTGEFVLVSGEAGRGKSALARFLAGLIPNLYHG